MRILLAHKFFRLTGGAESFFFETGRVLKENDHVVAYFSTNHPDNIQTEWNKYFIDPPAYDSPSFLSKIKSLSHIIYSKKAKVAFSKLIADFKPDVIHAFGIYTHLTPSIFEAAQEAEIPVLMSCNDYKHICPNYKIYDGRKICESCKGGRYYNAILKKCCKDSISYSIASTLEAYIHKHKNVYEQLVNRYLFASDFMLNKTKDFWFDKNVQYGVLKNPFNASDYHPVYQGDYALYFGRIIDEKGVDKIIDAAKKTNIPIKIIGDGPDLSILKRQVEIHKLNHVSFLGPLWGDELNSVLSSARFVIVPSLWHENFPYVIFQAFASGKPVIGSVRGGIPELIGNERGLLFEPENDNELVNKMELLWNDIDSCQCMGKLARDYIVRNYSDEIFYESLLSNYKAVLK